MMDVVRDCLANLDAPRARAVWAKTSAHLPQPQNDHEMLITLHHARTQAQSMSLKDRAYSHAWLRDHDLPSGLPDELKPAAERLYPKCVYAVGIAVESLSPGGRPRAKAIEKVMSDAVAECYADGIKDPKIIQKRMFEARNKFDKNG